MSRHPSLHTELDGSLRALGRGATLARGRVLAGRYVIGEELGRGAVGRVFRAYDRATRTRVALKVVHPEVVGRRSALARLGREVRHARDVQHPNVCRVFELVESEGYTFFTMELATRGRLRVSLSGRVRRPMADRLADARAAAAGLAAIHAAGLVHGDLKPENLLRMSDRRLVVSDFGLARPAGERRAGGAGTLGYMAPEVRQGRLATQRSDIWSLGVVLRLILFGDRAPEHLGPGPEAALLALCQACTAPVPARRPPDGTAVLARLEQLDGQTLSERLRDGRLPPLQALAIGVRLLEALATLHRRGRVHGAVVTGNVFLLRDGSLRLLDPRTDTPLAVAAPVAVPGEGPWSDLIAAGGVLLDCLAGQPGRREAALEARLARVPAPVRPVLQRMLAGVQGAATAGALALELAALSETMQARRRRRGAPGALNAEQRIACVVAVELAEGADGKQLWSAVRTAEFFGASSARLGDRAFVATIDGTAPPLDLASTAARCALALKQALPDGRFAIATGRLSLETAPRGEALERAQALLGAPGEIALDATSAALLSARFRVGEGRALLGESTLVDRPRTVLGKDIPCLGRDRELATLVGLWDECTTEPVARAVLVTAPAGTGKSRLLRELLDGARARSFQVLFGRGDALRAGAPFAMLGPALLAAAGLAGGEPPEVQRAALLGRVQRHLPVAQAPRVAAFLGEMADLHFPDDQLPALRAARLDPRLMADQTQAAWLEFLEAECGAMPVLLVLEDLHWGDVPSVQLVDATLRSLAQRPLMVLALARPGIDDRFGNLWAERDLQRISLPPLTPRSAQRLVQVAAPDLPASQVDRIVDRAGGNPFFLEELIRAAGGEGSTGAFPETIIGTVQARFDAVATDARRLLRAAAIFGQTFRAEGVRAVLGGELGDLDAWLDQLIRSEILFARPGAGGRELVFRHALLQEAAYDMLTAEDRALGHRRAGEFLEASGESQAILLVEHHERGGEWQKAARWCWLAVQQALDANDLAEVLRRVERGVRLGAQGETLAALRRAEAQARFWRGEYAAAEQSARTAMGAAAGAARLRATEELIAALGQQTRFDEIEALLQGLAAVSGGDPAEERAWLGAQLRAAAFLLVGGRYRQAEELLGRIERRRHLLEEVQELRLVNLEGQVATHRGDQAAATRAYQRALERARAFGDQRCTTEMLLNTGMSLTDLGIFEDAERMLGEALTAAERLGLTSMVACVLVNLAIVQEHLGRLAQAQASAERSRALARRHGDRRVDGVAESRLALLALAEDPARAERHARAAVETLRPVPPLLAGGLAALARVLLARGKVAEALARAEEAHALFQQLGNLEEGEASVRLAYGQCLLAAGDRDRAREVLAAAARRLEARAALIDEPQWREAFLARIPDHAQTLALHRA